MSALDRVVPTPRKLEIDSVDLAMTPVAAWELVRHGDLAQAPFTRALFALRTLPSRMLGNERDEGSLRLDDLASTPHRPGFRILVDDAPHEVVVGAIGKVWKLDIPFVYVPDADAFARFAEEGFIKVAWALQVAPLGAQDSRVTLELRVDATDEASWRRFKRYFALIGPFSHMIRRSLLSRLAREHGTPEAKETERPLFGDDLLSDAGMQASHAVRIEASPSDVWPWLVQMGAKRGGFYSIDVLDNRGVRSAREIHPDLQKLAVGDMVPFAPSGEGFEVLRLEPQRALVLGGLFDQDTKAQLRFAAPRPAHYFHVTWAFVLEPLGDGTTRLHARVRAAFSPELAARTPFIGPVHHLMQTTQLRQLAARAEGRVKRDDWRDVMGGIGGASVMAAAFLTSFLRRSRNHWGLDEAAAQRVHPGDELVPKPRWQWTHGVEIHAPASAVWPWIAQIGANRGGFYSYQWLENLAGCNLRNAETVHPEWAVKAGDDLVLHPSMPPLRVVEAEQGRWFVAYGASDGDARAAGRPWLEASWLFYLEPLGPNRCRFVSRYRCACSDDLATRLQFGEATIEPIGFAMDRRMLLGVKERAERA